MKAFALPSILFCFAALVTVTAQQVKVDLPHGLDHASPDPALITDPAVVVSIPGADEFYLNNRRIQKDQLGSKITELLKGSREANRIVYIAASRAVDYGTVVKVLNIFRERDVEQFRLIVDRGSASEILYGMFQIMIPTVRDPDMSNLKPNPLTLVATISTELELQLNHDTGPQRDSNCFSSVPNGLGSDPDNLQKWLTCLFDHRTKQRAFKVGMETRKDVSLDERIEKTVFVKAPRSIKYGDVARVINALKGAGSNPIGLQIDDLPE